MPYIRSHFLCSQDAPQPYSVRYQWLGDLLLVLLLPMLAETLTESILCSVLQDLIALIQFMWQDVGAMVRDPQCHGQLDAFFQQFCRCLPIQGQVDMQRAFVDSFVQSHLVAHLPLHLAEQCDQLLTQMEASKAIFGAFPTAQDGGSCYLANGSPHYVLLGSLLLSDGLVLQSHLPPDQSKDVVRCLRLMGLLQRRQGDGEKVVLETIHIVDSDAQSMDFVLEAEVCHRIP